MRLVTIVGARPQFIKAGPVSKALRAAGLDEFLVHTGQHYDYGMSQVFFDELELPVPDINLGIGSGAHGVQTGRMLAKIEEVLLDQKPDWLLIYGDTNSTLAGALAASKLHVPVAHIEAGLRSYNRRMPEEINRVVADHLAQLLFCPSDSSAQNLAREGLTQGIHVVGDVMADALKHAAVLAPQRSVILATLGLKPKSYCLATVHRAENTDDPERLRNILFALIEIALTQSVIFPVHPRTRQRILQLGGTFAQFLSHQADQASILLSPAANNQPPVFDPPSPDLSHPNSDSAFRFPLSALAQAHLRPPPSALRFLDPVGYLDMIQLTHNARLVLTDSGGLQKEAYWLSVPCVTLRDETEWIETTQAGWNRLVGTDAARIIASARARDWPTDHPVLYGDGSAARRIAECLAPTSLRFF